MWWRGVDELPGSVPDFLNGGCVSREGQGFAMPQASRDFFMCDVLFTRSMTLSLKSVWFECSGSTWLLQAERSHTISPSLKRYVWLLIDKETSNLGSLIYRWPTIPLQSDALASSSFSSWNTLAYPLEHRSHFSWFLTSHRFLLPIVSSDTSFLFRCLTHETCIVGLRSVRTGID